MLTLREHLLTALDENSELFDSSQRVIQDLIENDPINTILLLFNELDDPQASDQVIFLSLVIIFHCFEKTLVPISKEHRHLETILPPEIIPKLYEITFKFLVHPLDAIRNTAIHTFSTVSMTQIKHISEMGVDRRLFDMLTSAESVEASLSAAECVWSIYQQLVISRDNQQIIISALYNIISNQNIDISMLQRCIRLLGNFAYLLPILFNDHDEFLQFIGQILEFLKTPALKEQVYKFVESTVTADITILSSIIDPLMQYSVADLSEPAPREVLLGVILLWETLVDKLESVLMNDPETPIIIQKVIENLVTPILIINQNSKTNEVKDYTEWEPYTAAYSWIKTFFTYEPDLMFPVLIQYVDEAGPVDIPQYREGALKILKIIFNVGKFPLELVPSAINLVHARLSDEAPRVRLAALECLLEIVKRAGANDNFPLATFEELLFTFNGDLEPISKTSFSVLKIITKMKNFNEYEHFFNALAPIIPSLPFSVMTEAIECLSFTYNPDVSKDIVYSTFILLYNLLLQIIVENRVYSIIDMICKVLSIALINIDNRIEPVAEELCQIMYSLYNEMRISNALTVVSSLSASIPDFVTSQLPVFLPLVLEAQHNYQDPSILIPSIILVPFLVNKIKLGDYFPQLIENLFRSLQSSEGSQSKSTILNVLGDIMKDHPEEFKPYMPDLFAMVSYIVDNLATVFRKYFEMTIQLIKAVCKVIEVFFSLKNPQSEKQFIFELCVKLINGVNKDVNQLLASLSGELVDIIRLMLRDFPAQTLEQVTQMPDIVNILRSGLTFSGRSDDEANQVIDDLLRVLMPKQTL